MNFEIFELPQCFSVTVDVLCVLVSIKKSEIGVVLLASTGQGERWRAGTSVS